MTIQEFAKKEFNRVKELDSRLSESNIELVFSNRMKRSAGTAQCSFIKIGKTANAINLKVTLSNRWLKLHTKDEVCDTIRHELAHILNYIVYKQREDGHGRNWKRFAQLLGAKPERCFDVTSVDYSKVKKLKYSVMCNKHGEIGQISRRWKQLLFLSIPQHQKDFNKYGKYGRICPKCQTPLDLKQNY